MFKLLSSHARRLLRILCVLEILSGAVLWASTGGSIAGTVKDNPVVTLGGLEVIPDRVEVVGLAQSPLPVDEHTGPELRLTSRTQALDLTDTA